MIRMPLFLAVWLALCAPAFAQQQSVSDPYAVIKDATHRILDITVSAKSYYQKDPERYYQQVGQVLDNVVDFDGFSRGVMATYASARVYNSLQTDAERQAFRDRVNRFSKVLKRMLIVSYANAVLSFNGQRIEIEKPDRPQEGNWVVVTQDIYGDNGKVYVVQYQMKQEKDSSWKVRNMVVDGLNLGQVYRTQFADAVEKAGGDIDKVIDQWARDKAAMPADKKAGGS